MRTAAYFALKGRDRGCRLCKWTAQARRGADARVFGAGAMGVPAEGSLLDRSATRESPAKGDDDGDRTRHHRPTAHGRVPLPPQRLAVGSDAASISELMRASVLDLFPAFYDQRQTASAAMHIAHLDMQLIEDGTYFVHTDGDEIVACGGWSRRNKLYTGSDARDDDDRLLDPETEPARVRAMFVRGVWTRRGLGRAILDSCERAARQEGFKTLALGATLPANRCTARSGSARSSASR